MAARVDVDRDAGEFRHRVQHLVAGTLGDLVRLAQADVASATISASAWMLWPIQRARTS